MKKIILPVILLIVSLILIFILYKQYSTENQTPNIHPTPIVQTEINNTDTIISPTIPETPKSIETVILTGNIIKKDNEYELMGIKLKSNEDLSVYMGKWVSVNGVIEGNILNIQNIYEPNAETIKTNNPTIEGQLNKSIQGEFQLDKYQVKSDKDLSEYVGKKVRITTKRLPDTTEGKEIVELQTIEIIK